MYADASCLVQCIVFYAVECWALICTQPNIILGRDKIFPSWCQPTPSSCINLQHHVSLDSIKDLNQIQYKQHWYLQLNLLASVEQLRITSLYQPSRHPVASSKLFAKQHFTGMISVTFYAVLTTNTTYNKKAVLSQRWPRNATYGCPENFRDSLTTPTATIPNIFMGFCSD